MDRSHSIDAPPGTDPAEAGLSSGPPVLVDRFFGYHRGMSDPIHPPGELPSLSSSLLDRVQQMQPEAWAQVVTVFSPIVYRWCRQAGLAGHDASDVVQDVFSSVARGIGRFERVKGEGSFRSWLATITRNRVRDHLRRHAKQPQAQGGTHALQQMNQVHESLDHSISEADLNESLPRRVLELVESEFTPATWQAFWLTTVEGVSAVEVAERLQLNVASVYQAKSRVLRRFRQRLCEIP
jgi:RNA polymerase sigma-70 factor (ECF subfamily)